MQIRSDSKVFRSWNTQQVLEQGQSGKMQPSHGSQRVFLSLLRVKCFSASGIVVKPHRASGSAESTKQQMPHPKSGNNKSLEVANVTSSLLPSPPSCLGSPRTANETRPNEGLQTPPPFLCWLIWSSGEETEVRPVCRRAQGLTVLNT